MTTITLATPAGMRGATRRPGLGRLTAVELRKMVDTRAGFWLQLAVAALTVAAVVVLGIAGDAQDQTFANFLAAAIQPAAILLPVVGILLVSSEWSQRTAMITFTLEPRRTRVFAAKLLAGMVLALAALALSVAVAALGTAIAAPGGEGTWSLPAGLLGQFAVYLATSMVMGVGFGAMLLASAPAIVLYFGLPLAWTALGWLSFLEDAARWLDGWRSLAPMVDHMMSATEWARAGTTLAVWVLLPVAIGLWRIVRGEVR